MNFCVNHNDFKQIQNSYPPLLETFAVKKGEDAWGLDSEGRTVSWMKNVQVAVMDAFSNIIGLAGLILGAIAGTAHALISRDRQLIEKMTNQGLEAGCFLGLHLGATAGSLISSVIVPPASGLVNLFIQLNANTTHAPEPVRLPSQEQVPAREIELTITSYIEGIPRLYPANHTQQSQ